MVWFSRWGKKKFNETLELQLYALSPDLDLLDRRMTQFLGLHYQEPTIESGIDRLDLNQITFSRKGLEKLNQMPLHYLKTSGAKKTVGNKPCHYTKIWKWSTKLRSTNNFYRWYTLMIGWRSYLFLKPLLPLILSLMWQDTLLLESRLFIVYQYFYSLFFY